MRLRRRLSVLVAIALAPSLLLTAYNAARWRIFLEDEARTTALSTARFTSAEFEQIIDNSRQLMTAMTKYPSVPDHEEECTSYFKSVIADSPVYREAAIVDNDGKLHCSTVPIAPTLDVRDRIYFYELLKTSKLTVGTITQDPLTHSPSLHLSMPYQDADGSIKGAIVLILDPGKLAESLPAYPWRSEHRLVVLDDEGSLVLTLPTKELEQASAIAKAIFPKIAYATSGTIDIKDLNGHSLIVGFDAPKGASEGLFTAVAIDRDSALAETSIVNVRGIAFDFAAIILAVIGVWLAAYIMIDRPVRAIIRSARKREAGDTSAQFPKFRFSDEFGQLSAALTRMSDRIDELLKQKDLLLRELQHRVMNSLNLLSGLLEMQRRSVARSAAKEHLANARDRIIAMGTVYRHLYQAHTLEYVEFSEFLNTICNRSELAYVGTNRPAIEVKAEPLQLSGAHAISLGMLTHELITNALKHAYSGSASGSIKVTLKHMKDGRIDLRISDRGQGLPPDFKIEKKSSSLGMKVIVSTVQQLGGTLEINRLEPGTEFVIHLPATIEHRT
ncbi:MAG TPA: histidine kinase dimerization/phosphoacceptor domain -containing protein [Xanthobacteraceae bacterium]|jgi:two-component sensor histidine kinase|nr:histidine kinase dimerization/phosphoacceptor domain -containing protein [Xanthobacteraceae bacterium]